MLQRDTRIHIPPCRIGNNSRAFVNGSPVWRRHTRQVGLPTSLHTTTFRSVTEQITQTLRGTADATSWVMLETVFQYRTLLGKCDLGVGLEWDEIEEVTRIESMFETTIGERRGRRYRRTSVRM